MMLCAGQAWSAPPPKRPGPPGAPGKAKEKQAEPAPPVIESPPAPPPRPTEPLGYSGDSPLFTPPPISNVLPRTTLPVPDRWRIGWPSWDRYGRSAPQDDILMSVSGGDSPYTLGHPLNPYDRNLLKGDYPLLSDDIFVNFTAVSDTFMNYRQLPTPSGVSADEPGDFDIFDDGEQYVMSQSVFLTADLFKGNTAFRPVDWLVRVTGAYNYNRVELEERNIVNIDLREGDTRTDDFATLQEAFFEYHLGDTSPWFDIAAVRAGRQLFVSDFRGFIFNDVTDGVRVLGNAESNRVQYNLAIFQQNDKDTNSGLNELNWRDQQVVIANLFVQDFIWPGYTTQLSFHWNHDQSDLEYDNNGFLVVPDLVGSVDVNRTEEIDAYYLGWAGDGHIGRLNVNHAFYYVFGENSDNPIAGQDVDIGAFLGAIELSVDVDWLRPKVSFLYGSGDDDPLDGHAGGFDGIVDNPFFAGGPGSFTQGQAFRLAGSGVDLVGPRSLYFDLAGTKGEGQSNYVNPGVMLVNAGFDAEITPKLRASFNYNHIWFAEPESIELVLNQRGISTDFGDELNLVFQYRPLLNNNVILTAGGSIFLPGEGFEDIFEDEDALLQGFVAVTLTY